MPNQNPEQIARDRIDNLLTECGWLIQDKKHINLTAGPGVAVTEYQTDIGPADYVLFIDGKPVGIIEAKAEDKGFQLIQAEAQSKEYADSKLKHLDNETLPFVFESTGALTRFTDYRDPKPRSRAVFTFHRPETFREWVTSTLGDLCTFYQGYGFPKRLQGQPAGEYPFYKVGDISRNVQAGNNYLEFCENHISKNILAELRAKVSPKNTIVFAKIGEALKLNRRALIKLPGVVDNNAIGLKANVGICNDFFLFHFLNRLKLENYSRATTVPSVRKTDIEAVEMPIPPLPEQYRIVAKIEDLFSSLDKGIESLKTAQQQLKVYRQAVLKWAFEGKHPAEWREENKGDIVSADILLKRIQAEREKHYQQQLAKWEKAIGEWETRGKDNKKPSKPTPPKQLPPLTNEELAKLPELPQGWVWSRAEDICSPDKYSIGIGPFGSNLKVSDYRDRGIPLIFVKNITRSNFRLDLKYIDDVKFQELLPHTVRALDLLITKMGDPPGDCDIYPANAPMAVLTADCLKN